MQDERLQFLLLLSKSMKTTFSSWFSDELSLIISTSDLPRLRALLETKLRKNHLAYEYYFAPKGVKRNVNRLNVTRQFRHDYLLTQVCKKVRFDVFGDMSTELTRNAHESFFESERLCRAAHRHFSSLPLETTKVTLVSKRLSEILRELNPSDLENITRYSAHGPGSTCDMSITGKTAVSKYATKPAFTPALLPYVEQLMGPRWFGFCFPELATQGTLLNDHESDQFSYSDIDFASCLTRSNKFTTVPKTTFKLRPICLEPTLNLFFQKGIGRLIRQRLADAGNCIQKGQAWNRFLVSKACKLKLSTIDLSAASDSISLGIVENIMLRDENLSRWLHLLKTARVTHTKVGELKPVKLHKLSSMGNGFTFEFESALFLSIVRSVVPRDEWFYCSTYGDDIICPRKYAPAVCDLLQIYGFSVNSEKTFLSGLFYESCGADYFADQPVRPFYFGNDDDVDDESLNSLAPANKHVVNWRIRAANALRLYSNRIADGDYACTLYKKVYVGLLEGVSNDVPFVAPSLGDCGIIVPVSVAKIVRSKKQWDGYFCIKLAADLPRVEQMDYSVLLYNLRQLDARQTLRYASPNMVREFNDPFLYEDAASFLRGCSFEDLSCGNSFPLLRVGFQVKRQRVFVPSWNDELKWGARF